MRSKLKNVGIVLINYAILISNAQLCNYHDHHNTLLMILFYALKGVAVQLESITILLKH